MIDAGLVDIVCHRRGADAAEVAAEEAAAWLAICTTGGPASLALPGGRSPTALIAALGRYRLAWPAITITPTDERQVPADHELSNARAIRAALAGSPAAAACFVALDGPGAAARVLLPFDLAVLGMGADGHVASLFPGQPLDRPGLPPLIEVTPDPLPPEAPVPRWSWSLSALASARRILVLMTGPAKRAALDRALGAPGELPIGALLRRARGPVTIHWGEA